MYMCIYIYIYIYIYGDIHMIYLHTNLLIYIKVVVVANTDIVFDESVGRRDF